jgi:sirohydrochlorin ferrochelatase
MTTNQTALLLIAHGSREAAANADLHHVVEHLASWNQFPIVQASFLEIAQPDIQTGAAACIAGGARQVILVPYFLSPGRHVRRDLTRLRQTLAGRFPDVDFRLAEPLGGHPLLVQILLDRVREAHTANP